MPRRDFISPAIAHPYTCADFSSAVFNITTTITIQPEQTVLKHTRPHTNKFEEIDGGIGEFGQHMFHECASADGVAVSRIEYVDGKPGGDASVQTHIAKHFVVLGVPSTCAADAIGDGDGGRCPTSRDSRADCSSGVCPRILLGGAGAGANRVCAVCAT